MINLHFINDYVLIFNAQDWHTLRTKYKIIGEFFGSTSTHKDLPVSFTPEQTNFLIKKGIAKLISSEHSNSEETKEIFREHFEQIYEEEKFFMKEERKQEVVEHVNKIIKGKKKKGETNISAEDILKEEIAKLPDLKKENMVTAIAMEHPDFLRGTVTELPVSTILTKTTPTKCAVYEDLWEKGYYVTTGRKFGGDFLAYAGDPMAFHALYVVKCCEDLDKQLTVPEIITYGRLGNSVKKKFMFAGLNQDGTVKYISVNWMESQL